MGRTLAIACLAILGFIAISLAPLHKPREAAMPPDAASPATRKWRLPGGGGYQVCGLSAIRADAFARTPVNVVKSSGIFG